MIEEIEGIVIKETNYKESSKILNIYTKDKGIIGVISKGCKKVNSPLRGISNKLGYAKFQISYKEDKISTLISGDIINSFTNIMTDITSISYSSYILELCSKVYEQNNSKDIYDIMIAALLKIEEGIDPLIISNIVELRLLNYLGVGVEVNRCSICGSTNDIITVSSLSGGLVCKNCLTNEPILNEKTIKLIRLLSIVDINKVSKIKVKDEIKQEINSFIKDYYDTYTGIYIKSRELLKNLNLLK